MSLSLSLPQPFYCWSNKKAALSDKIEAFYEYLIEDCLDLDQSDARAIEKVYGLRSMQSFHRGYRSAYTLEHSRAIIEYELTSKFANQRFLLPSVTGIYWDERLRLNWPSGGLFVPCRREGEICALAIYPNPKEPNFYWFTSRNFPKGCAVSPSIHIAGCLFARQNRFVVLTPHILRADAIALQNHICAVAANKLSPNRIARQLRGALPFVRFVIVSKECFSQPLRQALNSQNFKVVEESEDESPIAA